MSLFVLPKQVLVYNNGEVNPLGKVYFYLAGTTTLSAPYTTLALDTPHDNPVEADSVGILPAIYLDPELSYKIQITDSSDALIYEVDDYNATTGTGLTATELANGLTVNDVNMDYEPGDSLRYLVTWDGSTDDTEAVANWLASADGWLYAKPGGVAMVDSALLEASNVVFWGNGATLKYRSSSTSDYVFKTTGDRCRFYNLIVDHNKSALSGTNGDGHTADGWGWWTTGSDNYFERCQSNSTPDNEAAPTHAPYGFVNNGAGNIYESCSADDHGYSAFLNLDVGAGSIAEYRNCAATDARRGWTNNGDCGSAILRNFQFTADAGGNSDVAILCEIGTDSGVDSFILTDTSIAADTGSVLCKIVSPRNVFMRGVNLVNTNTDANGVALYLQTDTNSGTSYTHVDIEGRFKTTDTSSGGNGMPIRIDSPFVRGRISATLEAQAADYSVFFGDSLDACDITFEACRFDGAPATALFRIPGSSTGTRSISIVGGGDNISTNVPITAVATGTPKVGEIKVINFHQRGTTTLSNNTTRSSVVQTGGGIPGTRVFNAFNETFTYGVGWVKGDLLRNTSPDAGDRDHWLVTTSGDGGSTAAFTGVGQVGYRTNAGSPSGALTPNFISERVFDTSGSAWYTATGTGNTDWKKDSP